MRSQRPESIDFYADMIAANEILGFNDPIVGEFTNIRMNTVDHLDIVTFIELQILNFQSGRTFTHHPSDLNDEHFQTMKACLAASRFFQRRKDFQPLDEIYFMEVFFCRLVVSSA